MGLYTPEISVSFKSGYVEGVGADNNLPTPRHAGVCAYLTQEQVDMWIDAAEKPDAPKEVYHIGQVFHDYKIGRFVAKDSMDAPYDIVFT